MRKSLVTLLLSGCLITGLAACNRQPSASDTTPELPNTEETEQDPGSVPELARSDYSEVPLPEDTVLVGADPEQIALNAFGISEPVEGNFQQEIVLVEQTADQALVTLTQTGLLDDSVEGSRYRLEFVPEGDQWRLNWAGRQVRCYPNRGSQTWTTANCS
jgi:hypothetical protein